MLVMEGWGSLLGLSRLYCRLWEAWGSLLGIFGNTVVYGRLGLGVPYGLFGHNFGLGRMGVP